MARDELNTKRVTVTVENAYYDKIEYNARQRGESISEFVKECIDFTLRYGLDNDYPLAVEEREQVNELVKKFLILNNNVEKVQDILIEGFNSLFAVTNGNYLEDSDKI